jgi:hypothetical protein
MTPTIDDRLSIDWFVFCVFSTPLRIRQNCNPHLILDSAIVALIHSTTTKDIFMPCIRILYAYSLFYTFLICCAAFGAIGRFCYGSLCTFTPQSFLEHFFSEPTCVFFVALSTVFDFVPRSRDCVELLFRFSVTCFPYHLAPWTLDFRMPVRRVHIRFSLASSVLFFICSFRSPLDTSF